MARNQTTFVSDGNNALSSAAELDATESVYVMPDEKPSEPEWITTVEAAEIMGVHEESVRRLCRQGKVEAKKWNREWQVARKSAESYQKTVGGAGRKIDFSKIDLESTCKN